ncbi:MAG: hypothetical protein MAG458_00216 [Nitrosopumilus sp.]|nr:hypothetical protein [Nitrosopumilus sp.]
MYSGGGIPSETCVNVLALIGNGKSSTIQTLLVAPPVFHETNTVSQVPEEITVVSKAVGITCSPPIFPILPHETELNSFGPFPPLLPSEVANADNHAIDDLNAPR